MKRVGWILVIALFAALPLAATETEMQCIINCPPGVNACSQCCMNQFEAAKGPCYDGCQAAQKPCFDAAWQSCQSAPSPQYCYMQASSPCQQAVFNCQRGCFNTVQIAGGCPGEVPPQKCPYQCQMWNPASQSCVGPQMNGCPPMSASSELHADTLDDIDAVRAKASADAAAAHTETLKAKVKAKPKSKKK
jgi:hypothetical protein